MAWENETKSRICISVIEFQQLVEANLIYKYFLLLIFLYFNKNCTMDGCKNILRAWRHFTITWYLIIWITWVQNLPSIWHQDINCTALSLSLSQPLSSFYSNTYATVADNVSSASKQHKIPPPPNNHQFGKWNFRFMK